MQAASWVERYKQSNLLDFAIRLRGGLRVCLRVDCNLRQSFLGQLGQHII